MRIWRKLDANSNIQTGVPVPPLRLLNTEMYVGREHEQWRRAHEGSAGEDPGDGGEEAAEIGGNGWFSKHFC